VCQDLPEIARVHSRDPVKYFLEGLFRKLLSAVATERWVTNHRTDELAFADDLTSDSVQPFLVHDLTLAANWSCEGTLISHFFFLQEIPVTIIGFIKSSDLMNVSPRKAY